MGSKKHMVSDWILMLCMYIFNAIMYLVSRIVFSLQDSMRWILSLLWSKFYKTQLTKWEKKQHFFISSGQNYGG